MADILEKLDNYLMLNEGSSRYLQGWLNVNDKVFDAIMNIYSDHIRDSLDYDNASELKRAEKEMTRYCNNWKKAAQKIASVFDKLANKMLAGEDAVMYVSQEVKDVQGVSVEIAFDPSEVKESKISSFTEELRKAILSLGSVLYTDAYKDNKPDSFLYQKGNIIVLSYGDTTSKVGMPENNEFEHFVSSQKNIYKERITF